MIGIPSFAMSLAEQVGMALTNSRLFQKLEVQVKFLSELKEISSLVNSTLNLDDILKTIEAGFADLKKEIATSLDDLDKSN